MSVSQSSNGLSLSRLSPVAAEAVRSFASIVEKGAATAKAFGEFAAFLKEESEREGAFADFELGLEKRVAALCRTVICKYIEDRDERGGPIRKDDKAGPRGRRRPSTRCSVRSGISGRGIARKRGRSRRSTTTWACGYLTNPAAYRALLLLDHCTPQETAQLFGGLGGMNPSSSHLKRLLETTGNLWKEKGEEAMESIREAETVPEEAVSCAVSLDGVMIRPDGDEEACWREASCGTVSFQDAEGNRLKTLSFGPEAGKEALKAQLAEEVAHQGTARPEAGRHR